MKTFLNQILPVVALSLALFAGIAVATPATPTVTSVPLDHTVIISDMPLDEMAASVCEMSITRDAARTKCYN